MTSAVNGWVKLTDEKDRDKGAGFDPNSWATKRCWQWQPQPMKQSRQVVAYPLVTVSNEHRTWLGTKMVCLHAILYAIVTLLIQSPMLGTSPVKVIDVGFNGWEPKEPWHRNTIELATDSQRESSSSREGRKRQWYKKLCEASSKRCIQEDLEDITVSRYFILKSQATFPNFKKLISGCFCRVGKLPGVPTSFRQEFSKKSLNVMKSGKTR